jgi:probable rRNA maturation factor
MKVLIDNRQEKQKIDILRLRQAALNILHTLECQDQCELSIVLVDDQEIQQLNREYRGIDRSTDVLSFAQQETIDPRFIQPHVKDTSFPCILGDVILSIETTQKQAEEHGHSFEKELNVLLIHGILHLLGYDHHTDDDASIMERLEQTLLNC